MLKDEEIISRPKALSAQDAAGTVAMEENLCDGIKTVKGFCYLGNRLNVSGGSEPAAVMAKTKIDGQSSGNVGERIIGNNSHSS